MKKIQILALTVFLLISNSANALSGKEGLACEALLCAVGIAIPASHDKCREVLIDWSIYLGTLGFFKKPPSCPQEDANGKTVGYSDVDCNQIQDVELKQMCLDARRPPSDNECSGLPADEREVCECEKRNRNGGGKRICNIR
jgi:hypothetical protein